MWDGSNNLFSCQPVDLSLSDNFFTCAGILFSQFSPGTGLGMSLHRGDGQAEVTMSFGSFCFAGMPNGPSRKAESSV